MSATGRMAALVSVSEEAFEVVSAALILAGLTICFFANRFSNSLIIFIGGALFGLLLWNEIVPQFEDEMAAVLASVCVLSVVGAVVGGVVAVLMQWVCAGASLGALLGLFIVLADAGTAIVTESAIVWTFSCSIAACLVFSYVLEEQAIITAFAAFGGLLTVYGVDLLMDRVLLLNTGVVLQQHWPEEKHCTSEDCHSGALLCLWVLISLLGGMVMGHLSGKMSVMRVVRWCGSFCGLFRYEPVPSGPRLKAQKPSDRSAQRTFTYPDNQAFNYFDPDKLPPAMMAHCQIVYQTADVLANFFGFQDDNVRNQVEHVLNLVTNHRRFCDQVPLRAGKGGMQLLAPPPATGVHSLHAKLFENYRDWCEALNVVPKFIPPAGGQHASEQSEVEAMVTDLMLYLCLWGESSNLRHMPECLCFLYHKMMQEFLLHRGQGGDSSLYAGYFLDHVVTPIWEVVQKHHHVKGDHVSARNYDDFNEFFWSPACLSCSYRDVDVDVGDGAGMINTPRGTVMRPPPVHKAMELTPKTFLEKRSFLGAILTFNRILEFHLVSFHVLAGLAFADMLVWDTYYTLQMVSSALLTVNFLPLLWCMLEVWQAFPGINITGTAKAGFIIRLSARFTLLCYQTLYWMWSVSGTSVNGMDSTSSSVFWWWQYIWISLFVLLPNMLEFPAQIVPWLSSATGAWRNNYWQAYRNLCYPHSRLYVGGKVRESFVNALGYLFFWVTLICFKMWFSYTYEVRILILPTVELFDDYVNFPGQNWLRTALLVSMRWIPQLLIYLIDTSIWFAVWTSIAGTIRGFDLGLGEVRDFKGIRSRFMRIPEVFCSKVVAAGVSSRDTSMVDVREASRVGGEQPTESTSLLSKSSASQASHLRRYVAEFLDVRTQKWAAFAAVWNEVINQMRLTDAISNAERDMLKFHSFIGFSKPVYLPIFQTAGSVEETSAIVVMAANSYQAEEDDAKRAMLARTMMERISGDVTLSEAISEVWELGTWLLRQLLGPNHEADMTRLEQLFLEMRRGKDVGLGCLKMELLPAVISSIAGIVSELHKSLSARSRKGGKGADGPSHMRKVSSASSGINQMAPQPSPASMARRVNLTPHSASTAGYIPDKTRDAVRDRLRPLLHTLKGMVKNMDEKGTEVIDRLTFVLSHESGFMWDDVYACGRLDRLAEDGKILSILSKLHGLLGMQLSEAEPASPEARRRLSFFVNSLFMDMPRALPVGETLSWTVMTPYYSEDVLYSRQNLEHRNEDGLSTLLYLQALYSHDWRNFLERMQVADESLVWNKKHFQELRLWASLRAQTLSRTVEGMMYYEAALRLLAHLEKIRPEQVEDIVKQKFQYVVSCQVYGRMIKNQDPKADDINRLMLRFPTLRVAYIDEVRMSRGTVTDYYSVLVKGAEDSSIQEVYRVKLPGNPVLGEGKPENQNHALIFTRGEHIQAIDMNQEGYFEEALKMRCLLREFVMPKSPDSPPTTIVGFREHIFTGSVSSLANYMALQEQSFVTLGQRVLTSPLRIRMHYGHPDLFDKVFFMTRGGISKASKGINLSEDIFAGYNNCIRGGQVEFKEYVSVGKGRDVGMQQIYKFEAKLAQGAAEQCLSRDVNRMGANLDYFRLISFYFGGLGYYIGNYVTVLLVVFVVYFMLGLAVFGAERIGERKITPEGTLQMLLAGMGILNTLPMLATLTVEKGLAEALLTVGQVFISGGPMYFMFHIQTRAHYFYQTLLAGGAQYRATGRGFVTHHHNFDDLYRFFASSHFYLGFELMTALIIMAVMTEAHQYLGRTWSLWLAALSFLLAPFWFNPLSLEWGKVSEDYKLWVRWMVGNGGGSNNSWEVWWREENAYLGRLSLGQKLQCLVKPIFYLIIGFGIGLPSLSSEASKMESDDIKALCIVGAFAFVLLVGYYVIDAFGQHFSPSIRRSGKLIISVAVFIGGAILVFSHLEYIKVAIGAYYIFAALSAMCILMGFTGMRHAHHIHDFLVGHVLFILLFLLAALQVPKDIQTWLLFHNALSQGVVIEDILKYARRTQEQSARSEDDPDDTAELKKIIKHQEYMIQQIMNGRLANGTAGGGGGDMPNGKLGPEMTMPLDDGHEGESQVQTASMMRASKSTLDLSSMATTSSRSQRNLAQASLTSDGDEQPPRQDAESHEQQGAKAGGFQFWGPPAGFPPRDQA